MSFIRKLAKRTLSRLAYHYGKHRRFSHDPALWILMYHRILPLTDPRFQIEEPGMVVTPETFEMHLQEIKRYFTVMSLKDWVNLSISGGQLPAKTCVVTFDDGWLDNYEFALPLLKKHKIPATLFAVADKIGTSFQFWPNLVMWLLFNGGLALLKQDKLLGSALPQLNQTDPDREFAAAYISNLKKFSDQEIFDAIESIRKSTDLFTNMPRALMNWDELAEMQASGLVDIGSHTSSHKRLTNQLNAEQLQHEIQASRNLLESRLQQKINLFCFPNGDYNQSALDMVKSTYAAAVTTQRGIVSKNNFSLHELKRIGMHEQISRSKYDFGARLSGKV
jgi:peptidoglycan/xylan/chitin deacetylase (PgdA/CDA1 family)